MGYVRLHQNRALWFVLGLVVGLILGAVAMQSTSSAVKGDTATPSGSVAAPSPVASSDSDVRSRRETHYRELSRRPIRELTNRELADLALLEAMRAQEGIKPGTIATIVATLIAGLALLIAVVETHESRKAARRGMAPLLTTEWLFGKDEFILRVENAGPGPAIIESMRVRLKDEVADSIQQITPALRQRLRTAGLVIPPGGIRAYSYAEGDVIRPGDAQEILGFENPSETDGAFRFRCDEVLCDLVLELPHESVFGEAGRPSKWKCPPSALEPPSAQDGGQSAGGRSGAGEPARSGED